MMASEDNLIGVCCALTQFQEADEVEELIRTLPEYYSKTELGFEFNKERYSKILNYYQAQPHLIDSHLSQLLELLVNHTLNQENDALTNAASVFAVHLVKVRGYKIVVRHLPHEVKHVEAVLQILERQDNEQQSIEKFEKYFYYWNIFGNSSFKRFFFKQ